MAERPQEIITPPNMLRVKVGGRVGFDAKAIERAEAALQSMSGEFAQWLETEVTQLDEARNEIRENGLSEEARQSLHRRAHDLKGLGATYGYPLVSRIAGLLSLMLENQAPDSRATKALIDAHVDAVRAAVRDEIKTEDHPVGKALVAELEQQVSTFTAAA